MKGVNASFYPEAKQTRSCTTLGSLFATTTNGVGILYATSDRRVTRCVSDGDADKEDKEVYDTVHQCCRPVSEPHTESRSLTKRLRSSFRLCHIQCSHENFEWQRDWEEEMGRVGSEAPSLKGVATCYVCYERNLRDIRLVENRCTVFKSSSPVDNIVNAI